MQGDYQRYISEYAQEDRLQEAAAEATNAYSKAIEIAKTDLATTNPVRLGLFLNYSVFLYEVKQDPSSACQFAKQAFDDAIADIEHIKEESYKDATTIMQLIRDNLTLWTSEMDEQDNYD